jgi:hypothetical protein
MKTTTSQKADAETGAFLAGMGLPESTTQKELAVILSANVGAQLPLKAAVYPALLRLTMQQENLSENNARAYLAEKFPDIEPAAGAAKSKGATAETLRGQLIKIYNLPADATEQDITNAAAAAKDAIDTENARRDQEEADEARIAEKMNAGISREQAVSVIKRQREHDAHLEQVRASRRPRLLDIIRLFPNDLRQARRMAASELTLFDGAEFNAAVAEVKQAAA